MLSLPRLRGNLMSKYPRAQTKKEDIEESQNRFESLFKVVSEGLDKLRTKSYLSINDKKLQLLLNDGPQRMVPFFRYETRPIEVKLRECKGDAEAEISTISALEDNSIFTEKCSVSFTALSADEENKNNASDPSAFLGELSIVIKLECKNPKPGLQIHRLNNLEICGFGPTKWTIAAFYEEEKVFQKRGVSNASKGEDITLGNFEFSFTC